jgi:hypothetical protein
MHTQNRAVVLAVAGVTLAASLQAQSFDILFRVTGVKGSCQVKKPDAAAFEPVTKGKAYPFGTTVRTGKDGEAFLLLSPDDSLRLSSLTEVTVTEPAGTAGNSNRVVRMAVGKLDVSVRDSLPEKALIVETAVASCDAFAGRSSVDLQRNRKPARGQLDQRLLVRTDNGAVRVAGPQFTVPRMKSGSALRIDSSADGAVTMLVNESNDYKVEIDNGTDTPVPMDTTTRSAVRICREPAPVGKKLVVSVLETTPDGKGKSNFAFVVGEPTLTSNVGLPEEHSATGTVSAAAAPATAGTNAAAKVESLF